MLIFFVGAGAWTCVAVLVVRVGGSLVLSHVEDIVATTLRFVSTTRWGESWLNYSQSSKFFSDGKSIQLELTRNGNCGAPVDVSFEGRFQHTAEEDREM